MGWRAESRCSAEHSGTPGGEWERRLSSDRSCSQLPLEPALAFCPPSPFTLPPLFFFISLCASFMVTLIKRAPSAVGVTKSLSATLKIRSRGSRLRQWGLIHTCARRDAKRVKVLAYGIHFLKSAVSRSDTRVSHHKGAQWQRRTQPRPLAAHSSKTLWPSRCVVDRSEARC